MKKKERTGPLTPLTNHLKESESSEEYTAGSCRGQHFWTRAPPTGGGVVGAGKCRCHADGRATVTFGPAFQSPPLNFCTHPPSPPFLSFQPHHVRDRVTTRLRLWGPNRFYDENIASASFGIQNEYFGSTRWKWKLFWKLDELKGKGLTLADEAGPISITPAILASSNERNSTVAGVGGPGFSPAKAA
ncbi:hypothetical protein THAOC_02636 [Thalassiosira oceanica]|uniref:Uncharacterized protein n=1 Tax=Thalassiosira oceanica TaxID=159749 RepID=K0TEW7_THAOC|nr:hypothetical protein THAOC_02636 [Thalassiosira oceanica]|eukprot:EJK75634.1 hypothetical protein THAOC_02636 [Thalassiosira oceanica]